MTVNPEKNTKGKPRPRGIPEMLLHLVYCGRRGGARTWESHCETSLILRLKLVIPIWLTLNSGWKFAFL